MTWERVALGDLGQWFGGATPSKGNPEFWTDGSIPWLTPKDMGATVIAETQDRITPRAVTGSSVKVVPAGSVAVVLRSGILARTLPVGVVPFETTLNQDMKALVPRPDVDPCWVAWGLRAFERELLATTRKAGTTVASIEFSRLKAFGLHLPGLAEQQWIVEIIEDHLSRLGAAVSSAETALRRTDAFNKSVLDRLIWDDVATFTTVADVLREPMRNGRSGRASDSVDAVRVLTLTAVTRRDFSERNTKSMVIAKAAAEGLWLEPGDIFIQRSNTPHLVGTSARYAGPRDWAIFPDLLIRVRPDESRMDSRYLVAALSSERAHRALRARAKGLAGSMPKIDQAAVGATVIPLPSPERQRAVVAVLEDLQRGQTRIRAAILSAQRRCAALRRAVLAAAFEGKLTGRSSDAELIEERAEA